MNNQNATIHIIDDDPGTLKYLSELVETLNLHSIFFLPTELTPKILKNAAKLNGYPYHCKVA